MKKRLWIAIGFFLFLLLMILNYHFELVAFHPFCDSDEHELRVLTWNVHCSRGAEKERQRTIAELILKEDADFVLLNEYDQDSCLVIDSLLRVLYPYTEEYQSHQKCGDIFYSKRKMSDSGHMRTPIGCPGITALKSTILIDRDTVNIVGVHLATNSGDGSTIVNSVDSLGKLHSFFDRYKDRQQLRNFTIKWVKQWVLERGHPTIVMGDMNDFNCSAPLDSLTDIGLKDSWWEGGTGYGCTFHTGWMWLRLDHIFHSKDLELTKIKVIDTKLSDHNPIVAEFKMR